ncbi:MAG: hypothetical protein WC489_04945 [Patescibacteria group bacterium]
MSKFSPGDVGIHKATGKRFVVIKIEKEGEYVVRTQDNLKDTYFEVELETEVENERRIMGSFPKTGAKDYGIG